MDSQNQSAPPESSAPPDGLKAEVTSFLRDTSAYLRLRSELFSIEAKEAGQVYGKKTKFVILGGAFLAISYLLILASLVGIIAALLDPNAKLVFSNWIGASLILAGFHLIVGFLIYRKGRKTGMDYPLFEYTRNELQNEQEWLKHKRKP